MPSPDDQASNARRRSRRILDGYVIGQEDAKTDSFRLRCITTTSASYFGGDSDVELQKSNILLLGPTGCGQDAALPRLWRRS